jgi:hypothetical protein
VVDLTVEAYKKVLKINLPVLDNESDIFISWVRFFTRGDLQEYLLDVIDEARRKPTTEAVLPRVKVPSKMQSWIRVPSSTWLISGMTIVVSVIGFLFMKGKGNKKDR